MAVGPIARKSRDKPDGNDGLICQGLSTIRLTGTSQSEPANISALIADHLDNRVNLRVMMALMA